MIQKITDALFKIYASHAAPPATISLYIGLLIVAGLIGGIAKINYDVILFERVAGKEDVVRSNSYKKYLLLPQRFHNEASSGQIMNRIERGSSAKIGRASCRERV